MYQDKSRYILPVESTIKAMTAWGWSVELDSARSISKAQIKKKQSKLSLVSASNNNVLIKYYKLQNEYL